MPVINKQFSYDAKTEERLDKYLTGVLIDLSRSRIQQLISDGNVLVNDEAAKKSGVKLENGDQIAITIPEPVRTDLVAEDIQLEVIYEDTNLIVVNKPAGMVVHPSAGHTSGTLVNAALAHSPEMAGIAGEGRPGIVHRLDKDTSGLILLAKNDRTHHWLQAQFKARKVQKVYLALVDRHPPTAEGIIDAPIGRDPSHRQRMAIVPLEKGRESKSQYKTLQIFKDHTLLEVHPTTGRTHQIRLHLTFIGCPIAGDKVYGYKRSSIGINRHFLHAARITICLPGETTPRTFEAPLPQELEQVLIKLSA